MKMLPILLACCSLIVTARSAPAQSLPDLADQCENAAAADNKAAFSEVAAKIIMQKNVFDTSVRTRLEDCLTSGYGEPWEYDWPSGSFMSSAAVVTKLKAAETEKARKARAAADAASAQAAIQAAKGRNADRVAQLVYASCITLLRDDQVAAMTNQLCVESFLTNGLPPP